MTKNRAQVIFTIFMLVLFAYTAFETQSFKKQASYFPLYISVFGMIAMSLELGRQFLLRRKAKEKESEPLHPNLKGVLIYSGLLVAYIGLVYVIGIILATIIYMLLFLYFIAKMNWWRTILSVVILVSLIITFGNVMNLFWPKSLFNLLTIMPAS